MSAADVRIRDTAEQSAQACGTYILQELEEVLKLRPRAVVAISGGTSPKPLFSFLAKADFDWPRVHFFWVDERCVPPDNDQSNFRMTRESLLEAVRIPQDQIHRIQGELRPDEAARLYEEDIRRTLGTPAGELPVFDLVQQGMGPDAHTASLFPGEPLIEDRTRAVAAVWVEKFKQHRVTLLPGVLERARHKLLLVTGAEKADALLAVMHGPRNPLQFPSQIIAADAVWYTDKGATSKL